MNIRENKVHFGSIAAEDLVAEFGSPLYVYEYDIIADRVRSLQRAFRWKDTKIYYAAKANSNLALLKIFRELGTGIDAVSPGEVFLAMNAGFQPDQIILTGTNLSRSDIEYALEHYILINIDNIDMLKTCDTQCVGKEIALRLNPDIRAGGHTYLETGHRDSKFGLPIDNLDEVKSLIDRHDVRVVGLHYHIGSEVIHPEPMMESLEKIIESAKDFPDLRFIDIGGGFKVKYHPDDEESDIGRLGQRVSERFELFCKDYGRELTLIIEPGKFLISDAGFLLTTVHAVKDSGSKTFVGTDTGMNHLIRPALYNAYHEILNASGVNGNSITADIVGNICESADVLGNDRSIAVPKVGDVLCVKNAGSYGFSMASNYNSRALPAEVLVRDNHATLIRRRQALQDLLRDF
jgi:diaminopimelate decarboxylase